MGHPAAGIAGFTLVGLGLANLVPILFGAAARTPGAAPGPALAAVATSGYAGFLAGPPLIGVVAEAAGLPLALGLVVVCCALVAARAGAISPPGRRAASTPSSRDAPSGQ